MHRRSDELLCGRRDILHRCSDCPIEFGQYLHINRDLSGPAPCRDCAGQNFLSATLPSSTQLQLPPPLHFTRTQSHVIIMARPFTFIGNRFESPQHSSCPHRLQMLAQGGLVSQCIDTANQQYSHQSQRLLSAYGLVVKSKLPITY